MIAGNLYERELAGGRLVSVHALTYGRARLCIGPAVAYWYEDAY